MPPFVPIIGSSFDNIGQQQFNWQARNDRVDEGNLARAAQAQEAQNNWLARLRQSQEQDVQRQAELDARAQEVALRRGDIARSAVEDARRFDINTQLTKDDQAVKAKQFQWTADERNKAERKAIDEAANWADAKKEEVDTAAKNKEQSFADAQAAQVAHDTQRTKLESDNAGKIIWDAKTNEFVGRPDIDPVQKASNDTLAIESNNKIAKANADAKSAADLYNTHLKTFSELQNEWLHHGLTTKKIGDKTVLFHPAQNKYYGVPADAPPTPPPPGPADYTIDPNSPLAPKPFQWTAGTGTNPAMGGTDLSVAGGVPPADSPRSSYMGWRGGSYVPPPAGEVQPRGYMGWRGGSLDAPAAPPAVQSSALPVFNSPADVKAAFQSGKLTRDQARQILNQQFGMPIQ